MSILFLKEKEDNYEQLFSSFYQCYFCQILTYAYVNIGLLQDVFFSSYDIIALTSPRAAQAIIQMIENSHRKDDMIQKLKTITIYSVGKATSLVLYNKYGIECRDDEMGCSEKVAEKIMKDYRDHEKLSVLFLCGEKHKKTIETILMQNNIEVKKLIVYRAAFESRYIEEMSKRIYRWIICFSPSAVDALEMLNHETELRIATIGKTTETALTNQGWKVHAVACKPTPESLLSVIREYDERMD